MKYQLFILILLFITSGCSEKQENNYEFRKIKCAPEEMPEFDEIPGELVNDDGTFLRDTIFRTKKRRTVFKPCRELIYRATFKTDKNEMITSSRIKLMATGKRWEVQPEKQDEIIVQYEVTEEDSIKSAKYQLNQGDLTHFWTRKNIEGVIENVDEVWMHPFRLNQFTFTEVAPFPEVKFPLRIGSSWSRGLSIGSGWGDWTDTRVQSIYKVAAKENVVTIYGQIENCWKIEAKSDFKLGQSTFNYWFHEDLGFVKMDYKNYGNQTLIIELGEVIEN